MYSQVFPSSRATSLLDLARSCWHSGSTFRSSRRRNKNYTFGNQWSDPIVVDGITMSEEAYIRSEGNIPLKNNLIRRLVRNVTGIFRGRLQEAMSGWSEPHRQIAEANNMEEIYCRSMEEFLISGMVVHRKWVGRRNGVAGVWTDIVSSDSFFIDPTSRDVRGHDMSVAGQIHDLTLDNFLAEFSTCREEYERLSAAYAGYRRVSVVELWRRCHIPRRIVYDRRTGREFKVDEEVWKSTPRLHSLQSRWILDDVWRYCFLTSTGEILREGDSPYPGGGHPFVITRYPLIDGEIHSYVGDLIDQQRYVNRLITIYDWAIRASAKGVLLVPEESIPDYSDVSQMADEWSRFNGVIVYKAHAGQPVPQQVSGTLANVGIGELLNIQFKMMEDVSGVNGALQGQLDSHNTSGTLYSQQTENSMRSLRDLFDTFNTFISASLALETLLMGEQASP